MGRFGRSVALVGQSYRLLMQDKELMLLPLISGTLVVALAAMVFFGLGFPGREISRHDTSLYLPMFLFYVSAYAVSIFFQAAVVAGASERMRGGDPTIGSALAAASRRIGPILMWSIVAATVGIVLRSLEERFGLIGRIVVRLVGTAWALATVFVVPVIVLEGLTVPESVRRSVDVFKRTWGETVIGSASVGLAAIVAWVTLVAVVGLLAWVGALFLALAVGALGAVLIGITTSALQGIYVASLYRYATEGAVPPGFDRDVLARAFVPR